MYHFHDVEWFLKLRNGGECTHIPYIIRVCVVLCILSWKEWKFSIFWDDSDFIKNGKNKHVFTSWLLVHPVVINVCLLKYFAPRYKGEENYCHIFGYQNEGLKLTRFNFYSFSDTTL